MFLQTTAVKGRWNGTATCLHLTINKKKHVWSELASYADVLCFDPSLDPFPTAFLAKSPWNTITRAPRFSLNYLPTGIRPPRTPIQCWCLMRIQLATYTSLLWFGCYKLIKNIVCGSAGGEMKETSTVSWFLASIVDTADIPGNLVPRAICVRRRGRGWPQAP